MKTIEITLRHDEIFRRTLLGVEYEVAKTAGLLQSRDDYRRMRLGTNDHRWFTEALQREIPTMTSLLTPYIGSVTKTDTSTIIAFVVNDSFPEAMVPVLTALMTNHLVENVNRRWMTMVSGKVVSADLYTADCLASVKHIFDLHNTPSIDRRPMFM